MKKFFIPLIIIVSASFMQCNVEPQIQLTYAYNEDLSVFPNPERGWYTGTTTENVTQQSLTNFKNSNVTVVLIETNIGAFLDKPLDTQKLNEIDRAFSYARNANLSVVFRAAYDYTGKANPEPDKIDIILNHISQLKPIFDKYEDILFNVQAGFLGPWGEWHTSHYGKDRIDAATQKQVIDALLAAVPKSVTIAVRRPEYVRTVTGVKTLGAEEAFTGTKAARVAFHDDALLADATDMGTYSDAAYNRAAELAWINNHTRYTPMIGETCQVSSYNDTKTAIDLFGQMNLQSLNNEYHPDVLNKWKNSTYNAMNAFTYIGITMGYRFVLQKAILSEEIAPGEKLHVDLQLINTGFGYLLKEKKFEIVLIKDNLTQRFTIDEDARRWNKNEPISLIYDLELPKKMSDGTWTAYLGLSSTFDTLRDNPAYSVRFANKDTWDSKLGLNKIGTVTFVGSHGDHH